MTERPGPDESTAVFRPRARMVKILGEHLIRDNTVGLMELIKNAYDADARNVFVKFDQIRHPERARIIVHDDGIGMTEEVIRGPWFEPAHASKEQQKQAQQRTPLGRLPLGEKGVGRFATQRLGRRLELITRPEKTDIEFVLDIDWDSFEKIESYLDQIKVPIRTRKPQLFVDDSHGTRLTMTGARHPWRKPDLARFQASLMRLLSPRNTVGNFKVTVKSSEFPEIEQIDETDIHSRHQFRIDCLVGRDGTADYEFRHRDGLGNDEVQKGTLNLWATVEPDECTERIPACGSFFVQLSAWLLKADSLTRYGLDREKLRVLAGVSIYRDSFRLLPYGDEGDDWLGLDSRRINVPAARFGNRQIVGVVELDQVENPELVEKTNREGLQENQAYRDLRELVLGVVGQLEQLSLEKRREASAPTKEDKHEEVRTTIEDLKQELQRLKQAPRPEIFDEEGAALPDAIPADSVVVPKAELEELETRAAYVSENLKTILETEEDERETYLHLMGIGLAAERFTHEFDRLVGSSSELVQKLLRTGSLTPVESKQLDIFVNTLRNEIRLMGTLRYVRRSQKSTEVSLRNIVELVLRARKEDVANNAIQCDLLAKADFAVHMPEASVAQVVDNIIDNGIYWLKQKAEKGNRKMKIEIDGTQRVVLLSNNGPALQANVRRNLFVRPFTTSKPEGRGLGMYISSQILGQYSAQIRMVSPEQDPRVLPGAAFCLDFSRSAIGS